MSLSHWVGARVRCTASPAERWRYAGQVGQVVNVACAEPEFLSVAFDMAPHEAVWIAPGNLARLSGGPLPQGGLAKAAADTLWMLDRALSPEGAAPVDLRRHRDALRAALEAAGWPQ